MSKLYQLNRMGGAAAGGLLTGAISFIGAGIKKIAGSKSGAAALAVAKNVGASKAAKAAAAAAAAGLLGAELLGKKGGGGGGGGYRRRRGITGNELKGFHKVARLLHKEGMQIRHHKRSH